MKNEDILFVGDGTFKKPGTGLTSLGGNLDVAGDLEVAGTLSVTQRLVAPGIDTGSMHLLGTSTEEFQVAAYYSDVMPPAGDDKHELKLSGIYTGTPGTYTFKITSVTAGAEQFQWKLDAGAFSANVSVSNFFTTLTDGIRFAFSDSGSDIYVLNDEWTFDADSVPTKTLNVNTSNNATTIKRVLAGGITKG